MPPKPDRTCTLTDLASNAVLLPTVRVRVAPPQGAPIEAQLRLDPLVVGTSPDCDLVIADPRVSRRHCELRLTRRGVTLRDLGSKNGSHIGDVLVVEGVLSPELTASIGNTRITLRVDGAPSVVQLSEAGRFGDAIGQSVAMRALFAQLERVAATPETVLLLGESGTGKEVLARAIHEASPRRDGPFVVFDCGAVAPSLVEAELFGHAKGAFTGAVGAHAGLLEQASGGTLFIDELGELPLDLQPKLLRALEARQVRRVGATEWRPFDARVVAATHRNLRTRVAEGLFREDLYYRLAVVELHVPSLRERKDDIPALVERFLATHTPPRALADLPPHAIDLLMAHDWPGNVRELRNIVARLVLFPDLTAESLGASLRRVSDPSPTLQTFAVSPADAAPLAKPAPPAGAAPAPPTPASPTLPSAPAPAAPAAPAADDGIGALLGLPLLQARDMVLEQFERRYLAMKLREHGGNISRTADAIGVSRQLVHRLIDRYGLREGER